MDTIYSGYLFGIGLVLAAFLAYPFFSLLGDKEEGGGGAGFSYYLSELRDGRGLIQIMRILALLMIALGVGFGIYLRIQSI